MRYILRFAGPKGNFSRSVQSFRPGGLSIVTLHHSEANRCGESPTYVGKSSSSQVVADIPQCVLSASAGPWYSLSQVGVLKISCSYFNRGQVYREEMRTITSLSSTCAMLKGPTGMRSLTLALFGLEVFYAPVSLGQFVPDKPVVIHAALESKPVRKGALKGPGAGLGYTMPGPPRPRPPSAHRPRALTAPTSERCSSWTRRSSLPKPFRAVSADTPMDLFFAGCTVNSSVPLSELYS